MLPDGAACGNLSRRVAGVCLMIDTRSTGLTRTEEIVAALCQNSFLRLWSYPNVYKDDAHEFCDVIAIFNNVVFIFFVREKKLEDIRNAPDPSIPWKRWRRGTIDRQIATAHGAERYLRSGRPIYLNAKKTKLLPVQLDRNNMRVYKIIVAHGAGEACKLFSDRNKTGSLAISYGASPGYTNSDFPFVISLDKNNHVNVLDDDSLHTIMRELDTAQDLADFFEAKANAISRLDLLAYCGEEDLLANYWMHVDKNTKRHFIGPKRRKINALMIGEGEWIDVLTRPEYVLTRKENKISYIWDEIINRTCDNWLNGRLLGDADLLTRPNAIFEMAKEPRFMRRIIVNNMREAISNFPIPKGILRHMRYFSSYYENRGYVFLQFWIPEEMRGGEENYRAKRGEILKIACGAAKNKFPHLKNVVGICIEPPKITTSIGEDFVWLDCEEWSDEQRQEFERENEMFGFFQSAIAKEKTEFEFITGKSLKKKNNKISRNQICPYCDSGKKYKRCCIIK